MLQPGTRVKLNPEQFKSGDEAYGVGVVRCWIKPQPEPDADSGYWSIDFERLDDRYECPVENLWLQEDEVVIVF